MPVAQFVEAILDRRRKLDLVKRSSPVRTFKLLVAKFDGVDNRQDEGLQQIVMAYRHFAQTALSQTFGGDLRCVEFGSNDRSTDGKNSSQSEKSKA